MLGGQRALPGIGVPVSHGSPLLAASLLLCAKFAFFCFFFEEGGKVFNCGGLLKARNLP